MEILRGIVVLIHLIGFAILFGSWVVQATGARKFTSLMNIGLAIAAVAGLALAAPWGISWEMNYTKIAVKLGILLVIGAFIGIGIARQRKEKAIPSILFWGVGVLTVTNAALAVLWR